MKRALPLLLSVAVSFSTAFAEERSPIQRFLDEHPGATVHLRDGTGTPSLITGLAIEISAGAATPAIADLLAQWSDVLGYEPSLTTFEAPRVLGAAHATAYRFSQRHLGLPVLGADVAVSVSEAGHIFMVGNGLERIGRLPTGFDLSASAALRAAVDRLGLLRWSGKPRSVRQVIARVDGEWRATWEVLLSASNPFGAWRVLVDANSPAVLSVQSLVKTAQGTVYANCPELGSTITVALPSLTSTTGLSGDWLNLYSKCEPNQSCTDADRQAHPDTSGNYLIAPNEASSNDPFAEVQTYYHLTQMHDWYKNANNFTGLDYVMPVAVNYLDQSGYGMDCNAGYDPNAKTIVVGFCDATTVGGTGKVNFAYDAEVVMHEYTHGAVDASAAFESYSSDAWGLVGQHAGLNEGFADLFPSMVLDSSQMGRHISTHIPGVLRDLNVPMSCPANLDGEPHEDGKIWASANWTAYKTALKDPDVAKAVFQGLIGLSTTPTFKDAATGVLAAAAVGFPQAIQDALSAAYTAQGLMGCGREIEIPNGTTLHGELMHPYFLGFDPSTVTITPFLAQYVLPVPSNATSLKLAISAVDESGGNATSKMRVYVKPTSHVVYANSGMTAPYVANGQPSLTINNPAQDSYFILPVGDFGGMSYQLKFTITATYQTADQADGGFPLDASTSGPDASQIGLDASTPAGLDAASVVSVTDGAVASTVDGSLPQPGVDASGTSSHDGSVSVAADAGTATGTTGCHCGLVGGRDPATSNLALFSLLALAGMGVKRRRS